MSIITLTTDYGHKDHFVGALKGKLLSEFREATIVDLSHEVERFNAAQASFLVAMGYASFPAGTVHLIGVDAERNFDTRHLAVQWNGHFFVCADNGILSMLMRKVKPQAMVAVNIHDRLHEDATDLDVFVKVACHLARGGSLSVIGRDTDQIKHVKELEPVVAADKASIKGHVIYIDHFGNVVTNISRKLFLDTAKNRPYEITFNPKALRQVDRSAIKTILPRYADVAASGQYPLKYYEGQKLAIFNESGFLEIALFRSNPSHGSASTLLGLEYRDELNIKFLN